MTTTTPPKLTLPGLLARLGLVFAGLACGALTLVGLFTAFPSLLPTFLRDPLDTRRRDETLHVRYNDTDGDLFYHLPGDVRPPAESTLLYEHTVRWDENGFRIPAMTRDSYADYPIVALGDSFTDAWMVPSPWPDVLAARLNTPVLNLAYQGYGPMEEAAVFAEYGADTHDWVLVGFFEGNDLVNIRSTVEREEAGGGVLFDLVREAARNTGIEENPDGQYRYPLALYIGSNFYELAFYDSYLWVLNAEREVYAESRNVALLRDSLREIQAEAGGACVAVVYLPTKGHIYFPYTEPYGRRWILESGQRTGLIDGGWIGTAGAESVDFDAYVARLGNQRDVIAEVAADLGLHFIDLTPAFQAAAERGEMTYLTYDTHWNEAGHELAAQTVADYLAGVEGCE